MRPTLPIAALLLGCTLPATAQASDIGSQSSGSVTITVVIPPFAAALRAQSEGAVGLWTVTDSTSALMIKLPDKIDASGDQSATIFHGSGVQFAVSVMSDRVDLAAAKPEALNGMTRESFNLTPKIAAVPLSAQGAQPTNQPVMFLITGL